MAGWIFDETRQAAVVAGQIDSYRGPRRMESGSPFAELLLSEGMRLREGIASTYRALAIRQLFRHLNLDERRVFYWRLEHKLLQALALHHYCPGDMPATQGLGRKLHVTGPDALRDILSWEFPRGYFIKPALGDSSGEYPDVDKTATFLERAIDLFDPGQKLEGILDEQYVVQERLSIAKEYRVHTFEDQVVEDLSFLRYSHGNIPGERDAPNAYVQSILDRLPAGFTAGSLCGWDIALTQSGSFQIIETNFTGVHPVYRPGFQCSGYFQDPAWGSSLVARLLRFLEHHRSTKVIMRSDTAHGSQEAQFYADVAHWQERLKTIR